MPLHGWFEPCISGTFILCRRVSYIPSLHDAMEPETGFCRREDAIITKGGDSTGVETCDGGTGSFTVSMVPLVTCVHIFPQLIQNAQSHLRMLRLMLECKSCTRVPTASKSVLRLVLACSSLSLTPSHHLGMSDSSSEPVSPSAA